MSKRMRSAALLTLAALLGQTGCYTTRVVADRVTEGQDHEDRQWFTLGGLVRISDPGGRQCPDGFARVDSQLSFVDVLITAGLGLGGALVGFAACSGGSSDAGTRAACASFGGSLAPFLISPRTVRFSCIGGPVRSEQSRAADPFAAGAAPASP